MAVKRRRRTRRRDELSYEELWDLLLMNRWVKPHGPPGRTMTGGFTSPWERRSAWVAHREELLADHIGQGTRPGAWWEYDAPGSPLDLGDGVEEGDLAALVRLGEATPEEVRLFLRCYHLDFDHPDLEQFFSWHPQYRLRYEHERKLVEALERGEIKPKEA